MTIYVIPGNPTPWKRVNPNFKAKILYDSQKDLKFAHGLLIKQQHKLKPLYLGALKLDITFYIKPPKNKQKLLLGKPVPTKPDGDNAQKYIQDLCNGILYKDDAQIASWSGRKIYDLIPRTEFTLIEIQ